MARYFNASTDAFVSEAFLSQAVDEEHRNKLKKDAMAEHPHGSPPISQLFKEDGKLYIKVPPAFWQCVNVVGPDGVERAMYDASTQKREWVPGAVTIGLVGYGFWVVPKGESVDLPFGVSDKVIKNLAPHLVSEPEWMAMNEGAPKQKSTSHKEK